MEESNRTCRTCRQGKPEDEFYWHDKAHTKRSGECKTCTRQRSAARKRSLKPYVEPTSVVLSGETRWCIHCKKTRPIESFYRRKSTGRRGNVCDGCRSEQARRYHESGPSTYGRYRKYDRGGGLRKCRVCGVLKDQGEFHVRDKEHGTRRTECKPCLSDMGKQRYAADPAKHREVMRRSMFGLQAGEYAAMLESQGGMCAICGSTDTSVDPRTGKMRSLFVDHCHRTGVVRQLLCQHCNFGLGNFRDNPELMERAASYIRRFSQAS